MGALHFISMFVLMYAMVYTFSDALPNLNNLYMAAIMTAPMLIIETVVMGQMYKNKPALKVISALGAAFLVLGLFFIRQQLYIHDKELLRSMIPHHSGAILMCEKSILEDSETQALCQEIISSQQREINQMKQILDRLN